MGHVVYFSKLAVSGERMIKYYSEFVSFWPMKNLAGLADRAFCTRSARDSWGQRPEENLTFRRRIKSRLPFAGIIRRLSYSTRFQDKG